MASSCAYLGHQ